MTVERFLMEAKYTPPVYVEDVFSTYLYTGTGATQTITNNINLSTNGGLVWIKDRTNAYNHNLFDTARGATYWLHSNTTDQSTADSNSLTAFGTTGFTLGSGNTSGSQVNTNTDNFVSWTFRKQPKFFDIVTYTGNGSAMTISHNLGSIPGMIIVKRTNAGANWAAYHSGMTSASYYMMLNLTDAQASDSTVWNGTAPTSSVFSVGTSTLTNANTGTYVAYLFASDAGGFGLSGTDSVIKCGTCNSTEINLGWEPQFILTKPVSSTGNWLVNDNMRGVFAPGKLDNALYANLTNVEAANGLMNITATGFIPAWGVDCIYLAIRRGPMKTPTSGTSVFSPITSSAAAGTAQTTNFVIDSQWKSLRLSDDTLNTSVDDRLRGVSTTTTASGRYLITSSAGAEDTTNATTQYWNNTGFQNPTYYGGASSIYWNFARAPGFFDVVNFTTNSTTNQRVPHNLTVVPELIILKKRDGNNEWPVYVSSLGLTKYLKLCYSNAVATYTTFWGGAFTTTDFGIDSSYSFSSGSSVVAYLFATLTGVSKVGSYTGTGAAKNIDCGFAAGARFVMIKRTDSTGGWYVYDSARGINASGSNDPYLLMDSTAAEVTTTDYLGTYSSGFALTSTAPAGMNANGGTYIYLAIA